MKQKTNKLLIDTLKEVTIVQPNDLGFAPLTFLYRRTTYFFKTAPFLVVVPLALIGSTGIVYIFGILAVRLVTVLQYGF